jgi:hypothetical protein
MIDMFTNFNKKSSFLITLVSALLFITSGCKENKFKIDVSDIDVSTAFYRFDKDLLAMDTSHIKEDMAVLKSRYPDFYPYYFSRVITLGNPNDSTAPSKLKQFLQFEPTKELFSAVEKKFTSVEKINNQIIDGVKHFKYYFPNEKTPDIIYFSGVLYDGCIYNGDVIAIGLDMYLGNDYKYEEMEHLTNYLIVKMRPEYIPRNVIYSLGYFRFINYLTGKRFLDQMIYEGKLAYYMDAMMPDAPDSIKFSLSSANLNWCKENEWQIWKHFVDPKLNVLYNNNPETVIRYFEDGPFTNADGVPNIDEKSSPRFAVWMGRQIVRKYMDNNPDISLAQLMVETNSDKILKESKYKP